CYLFFFFFQAEDGIRDRNVTGVQTCALPIWEEITMRKLKKAVSLMMTAAMCLSFAACGGSASSASSASSAAASSGAASQEAASEIGRASCRERGESAVVGGALEDEVGGVGGG